MAFRRERDRERETASVSEWNGLLHRRPDVCVVLMARDVLL